jgi:hypothetical protein
VILSFFRPKPKAEVKVSAVFILADGKPDLLFLVLGEAVKKLLLGHF